MAGKRIDATTLAEVKRLYDGDELTLVQIGKRVGRSPSLISQLAKRHGWARRWDRLGRKPYRRPSGLERERKTMLRRYYRTVSRFLQQMETAIGKGEYSLDDFERGAKSVRAIQGGMGNVEKVAAAGTHADQEPIPAAPDDDSEAERIRREIMERFERIQQRRAAEGAAE
jgi:hypothetical protein